MSSFSRFGLLIALATTALLAGCKRGQQDSVQSSGERKPPSGSTLAIAGRMLDGADQATVAHGKWRTESKEGSLARSTMEIY